MSAQEQFIMRLYVGGLPYQTTEQDLTDLFTQVGNVTETAIILDRDTGRSKGFGFVEMSAHQEARSAIGRLNATTLGDRTSIVNQSRQGQSRANAYRTRERQRTPGYP